MPRNTGFVPVSLYGLSFEPIEPGSDMYRITVGRHHFTESSNPYDHVGQAWFHIVGVETDPSVLMVSVGWTHLSHGGKAIFNIGTVKKGPGFWEVLREPLRQYGFEGMLDNPLIPIWIMVNHRKRTKEWCCEPWVRPRSPGRPREHRDEFPVRQSIAPSSLGLVGWGVAVGTGWRFGRR